MRYLLLFFVSFSAFATPIGIATKDQVSVILTNEPCRLKEVKNLPYRAIWREPNGEVEGCFSVFPGPSVGVYFEDKTVAVIPAMEFKKVTGI